MNRVLSMTAAAVALLSSGCCCIDSCAEKRNIEDAKQMIRDGRAECVLVKGKHIYAQERGHGVSPLLVVYETHRDEMRGAVVVDKVIGRAAAAVAICGKVRHVHGEVMSEDALKFLNDNGISGSATLMVPRILNRDRSGLCPLERSVDGISEPEAAMAALREKVASMKNK
ncbi:MAG: DUF1893 domain-containing protein [Victivallaceae bacterium]|nr:DUF1893 domain-containing protein [Victivallaceae bacterium]